MIYLDNAATTKVAPKVLEEMLPYFSEQYGNASSIYSLGSASKKAVNQARRRIADSLSADMDEIYFTGGGSESDNWVFQCVCEKYKERGGHIITTKIEHHAILHTCEYWEKNGFHVTYLDVDKDGLVDVEKLKNAIRPDTIFISVMFANNEIGTIQPIAEIGKIAREKNILFHTDAVQAYGHIPISVEEMHIDFLSASAHKLNGPKGIGFLYVKKTVKLSSFIKGGAQEKGMRAGTENVPAIVGFGKAVELAMEEMEEHGNKERGLREYTLESMLQKIPDCILTGDRDRRLPGHISVAFPGVEGESLLVMLDMKGICASSGSACTVGSNEPSHVLRAIGLSDIEAKGSLRLTVSYENNLDEMDETVKAVEEIVKQLRQMSSLYRAYKKNKQ